MLKAIKGLGCTKQIVWRDVYCVPDYEEFFADSIQPISRAFKRNAEGEDWTQLQWIIEAKDDGTISTSYRAYASSEVCVFVRR